MLKKLMMETVDGEYQNCKAFGGAYTREHFFGKISGNRGAGRQPERRGHLAPEPRRPRPAQGVRRLRSSAVHTKGQPTVILAKTVKGYGMGAAGESLEPDPPAPRSSTTKR